MGQINTADRRTFKLSKLREPEYNPNRMTEAEIERLEASMEKFGVVEPPVVNTRRGRTGVIVGGSHRVRILKRRGNKETDCVIVDLALADEKELNLRLNRHRGAPVAEILQEFFEPEELLVVGFNDLDLAGFGMMVDEAAEELLSAATPNELPAELAIAKLREIQDALGATSVGEAIEIASSLTRASDPPAEFPVVDENISTDHQCPKCSYKWSGSTAPVDA